jgi:hypothetical protein
MKLNVNMHMALLYVAILCLVQQVAAVRHVKVGLSKPPLKVSMPSKKGAATNENQSHTVESPGLKVRVPTKSHVKVMAKPQRNQPVEADAKASFNPAQCFDLTAGAVMNVQSFKEHFGNKSFLLSLAPGSPDPSDEKALTTLYEALLGGCGNNDEPQTWLIDVGTGSGQVSALAANKGCRVAAFDADVDDVHSLKTSRCLNKWTNVFSIFPTMAAASVGGSVAVFPSRDHANDKPGNKNDEQIIHGVSLDGVFVKGDAKNYSLDKSDEALNTETGDISLLKITPQGCCSPQSVLQALQGAKKLLASGRVQCLAMEMTFENKTDAEVDMLRILEERGYQLAHTGPMGSAALEISESGAYVLYATDTKQLSEVESTLHRIRTFDERSGLRAYGNGISLNRDGKFFEYGELVFACKSGYPKEIEVRPAGKTRFGNGMWWIEKQNATNVTNTSNLRK